MSFLPRRSLLLAIALSCSAASAGFGTTVITPPAGFVGYTFTPGTQLVGFPLLHAPVLEAVVREVGPLSLTLDGADLDVGALLDGNRRYFLEVTSDPRGILAGERLDVDVSATRAATGARIVVAASPENTLPGALPAELGGCQVVLREHTTLRQLAQEMPGAFCAGDVLVKARDGGVLALFTFDGTTWRSSFSDEGEEPIRPGAGAMLVRAAAGTTQARHLGFVRTNDFVQPIRTGGQLLAEGYPVNCAPKPAGTMSPSRLFTNDQGMRFESGATLVAHDPSSGELASYHYAAGIEDWADETGREESRCLFQATRAVYLTTATGVADYLQLRPFSL